MVFAIVSVASLVVAATFIATATKGPAFRKKTQDNLTIDLQGYDVEETSSDRKCKQAPVNTVEAIEQMMDILNAGGNITYNFHQNGDYLPVSFNSEDAHMTGGNLCFGTFDGGKFCFDADLDTMAQFDNDGNRKLSNSLGWDWELFAASWDWLQIIAAGCNYEPDPALAKFDWSALEDPELVAAYYASGGGRQLQDSWWQEFAKVIELLYEIMLAHTFSNFDWTALEDPDLVAEFCQTNNCRRLVDQAEWDQFWIDFEQLDIENIKEYKWDESHVEKLTLIWNALHTEEVQNTAVYCPSLND